LFDGTPFGYAFFSTLHAHSKINAHTAPMNLRLRLHLPLIVPTKAEGEEEESRPACGIRVGNITRRWQAGKALVLDDCFEHEVWNSTNSERVLLLVDVWHPDVTMQERDETRAMFRGATAQGWLSK